MHESKTRASSHRDPAAPLWLTLKSPTKQVVFLFKSDDERPVIIGSGADASFRLPHSSPICFYLERRDSDLTIASGYVRDLRLNGAKVTDWLPLPKDSVVKFGEHRLELSIQTIPPSFQGAELSKTISNRVQNAVTHSTKMDEALTTKPFNFQSVHDWEEDKPISGTIRLPKPISLEATSSSAKQADLSDTGTSNISAHAPPFVEKQPICLNVHDTSLSLVREPEAVSPASSEKLPHPEETRRISFEDFVPPNSSSTALLVENKAPSTPAKAASPLPSTQKRSSSVPSRSALERIGMQIKKHPGLTVGGGVAAALLFGAMTAALSGFIAKSPALSVKAPPPPEAQPISVHDTPSSVIPVTTPVATPVAAPDSAIEKASPTASKTKIVKAKNESPEPDPEAHAQKEKLDQRIDQAVKHLITGRYDEASVAYRALADEEGASPEFKRLAQLMERHTKAISPNEARPQSRPDIYQ